MKLRQIRHRRRERLVVLSFRHKIFTKAWVLSAVESVHKLSLNYGFGSRPLYHATPLYDASLLGKISVSLSGLPETEPVQEKQSDDKIPLPDSFKEYQDKFNQAYKAELAKRKAAKKAYTDYVNMFGKNIVCCLRHENDKGLFNRYKLKPKE